MSTAWRRRIDGAGEASGLSGPLSVFGSRSGRRYPGGAVDLEPFEMTSVGVCDGGHDGRPIWNRARLARITRRLRRRDDRHLVQSCRDPSRQIETRVAIAFELEPVELAHPRAIGREEQPTDSRGALASHSGTPSRARSSVSLKQSPLGGEQHQIDEAPRVKRTAASRVPSGDQRAGPHAVCVENSVRGAIVPDSTSTVTSRLRALVLHGHERAAGRMKSGDARRA